MIRFFLIFIIIIVKKNNIFICIIACIIILCACRIGDTFLLRYQLSLFRLLLLILTIFFFLRSLFVILPSSTVMFFHGILNLRMTQGSSCLVKKFDHFQRNTKINRIFEQDGNVHRTPSIRIWPDRRRATSTFAFLFEEKIDDRNGLRSDRAGQGSTQRNMAVDEISFVETTLRQRLVFVQLFISLLRFLVQELNAGQNSALTGEVKSLRRVGGTGLLHRICVEFFDEEFAGVREAATRGECQRREGLGREMLVVLKRVRVGRRVIRRRTWLEAGVDGDDLDTIHEIDDAEEIGARASALEQQQHRPALFVGAVGVTSGNVRGIASLIVAMRGAEARNDRRAGGSRGIRLFGNRAVVVRTAFVGARREGIGVSAQMAAAQTRSEGAFWLLSPQGDFFFSPCSFCVRAGISIDGFVPR